MKGVRVPLGDAIARVEAYCRAGRSATKAARAIGVEQTNLRDWLIRGGYATRKRSNRPWTTHEDAQVRRRAAEGATAIEVAAELGRGVYAVQSYAGDHGISFHSRHVWTDGQRKICARIADDAVRDLAEQLRLPASTVRSALTMALIEEKAEKPLPKAQGAIGTGVVAGASRRHRWTPSERRIMRLAARRCGNKAQMRLDLRRTVVLEGLVRATVRGRRFAPILDLGGMRTENQARPKGRAA